MSITAWATLWCGSARPLEPLELRLSIQAQDSNWLLAMPPTRCHIAECDFATPDVGEAIATVMLKHHLDTKHATEVPVPAQAARAEMKKPNRPIVKEDSTDQDWATF